MTLKFKQFATAFTLFFTCLGALSAQKATLSGTVTDAKTQEPLIGVTINAGDGIGGVTDIDGKYKLTLEAGDYVISFSYLGYENAEEEISLEEKENRVFDLAMEEAATMLNEATVTSSKFEKPLGKVTVSLDIIKPSLIDNTNATSVDNVLEKVPGVSVMDGQANIRGGSGYSYGAGSRVLLMIDDMPFLQGDAGYPNWRDVPVENIEQVEVLKGAASALYGSSALNGIINIRTAYAKSEPVTRAAMYSTVFMKPEDGRDAWWGNAWPFQAGAQFAHRQRFNRFDLVLGGNIWYDNSFRSEEFTRKARFNANLRFRATDKITFGVNVNVNGGPSGSFFLWNDGLDILNLTFADKGDTTSYVPLTGTVTASKTLRANIDPFVTIVDRGDGRHKFQGRYYHIKNDNTNNQSNTSNLAYAEYQYQRAFSIFGDGDLQLAGGAVATFSHSNSQLFGNAVYDVSNYAAYLQADEEITDKLNVSVGFRYEYNRIKSPDSVAYPDGSKILNPEPESKEGKPVFRIGANYQAAEYTYIRGSFGQGYRFPTVAERYVATKIGGALNILPNPTLQSETGWSAEIGVKQGFKISDWMGYIDVAGFWTEYQNMMEFNFRPGSTFFDFGFQSRNIGNTRIRGAELTIMGQGKIFGHTTTVIGGYTYLDPRFKDFTPEQDSLSSANTNILKYRYQHSVKMDIQTNFGKFDIGVAFLWNSRMEAIDEFFSEPGKVIGLTEQTWDWFNVKEYRDNHEKHGWSQLDLRAAWHVSEKVKVSAILENVLNTFYTIRPALPAPPRNFTMRLDYNF